MGRLDQAGSPAFLLAGNHAPASVISRTVPWPPNVRLFGSRRPETHRLPELSVAVHGQSFSTPAVTENLVLAYPPAEPHAFRSEEHTSELQSLMRTSYAVFCLKKKKAPVTITQANILTTITHT